MCRFFWDRAWFNQQCAISWALASPTSKIAITLWTVHENTSRIVYHLSAQIFSKGFTDVRIDGNSVASALKALVTIVALETNEMTVKHEIAL